MSQKALSIADIQRGDTFRGKPCRKAGHTLRYRRNGKCVECNREGARKRLTKQ